MRPCESQWIEQYLLNKQVNYILFCIFIFKATALKFGGMTVANAKFQLNISNSYHNKNLNLEGMNWHGF